MRLVRSVRVYASVLLALVTAGCSDSTGPAGAVSLVPEQSQLSLGAWQRMGLSATFANHGFAPVNVRGESCLSRGAFVDRWTGGQWQELSAHSIVGSCGGSSHDNDVVGGSTLPIFALSVPTDTGRYRLRLPTSVGTAISGPIEVR